MQVFRIRDNIEQFDVIICSGLTGLLCWRQAGLHQCAKSVLLSVHQDVHSKSWACWCVDIH